MQVDAGAPSNLQVQGAGGLTQNTDGVVEYQTSGAPLVYGPCRGNTDTSNMVPFGVETQRVVSLVPASSAHNMAFGLTQRKRFYISDYGYGNVREVINEQHEKLIPGQNWDKFYLENIITWWKRKASKRYEKLKQENRFRDKVELWTEDEDIQIIR